MSDHSLPKSVDPLKYADQRKLLQGILQIGTLPRLSELLANSNGEVAVSLDFGRDEQNLRIIKGSLSASVDMTCERCLEPVTKLVESEFILGLILEDEQAKNLPRSYEPLLVEPDKLVISDVVEEELILSLPMFAYHEDCDLAVKSAGEEPEAEEKPNPFQVLADLKLK